MAEETIIVKGKRCSDLLGANKCSKIRSEAYTSIKTTGDSNAFNKAVALRDLIKGIIITKEFLKEQIQDLLEGAFTGKFALEGTEKKEAKNMARDVNRYVVGEERQKYPIQVAKDLGYVIREIFFEDSPDMIRIYTEEKIIETICYKSSKPKINQKTGYNPEKYKSMEAWLPLYVKGLKYAMTYLTENMEDPSEWEIKASMYYMRKETDTKLWDPDFFSGNGGNIVSLRATYNEMLDPNFGINVHFEDYIEKVELGLVECDEDACKYCFYYAKCNYKKPNEIKEAKVTKKKAATTPSEGQQKIIDEVLYGTTARIIQVIAGAGAGKTYTLDKILTFLITLGFAKPEECIIFSFTNVGVDELTGRINDSLRENGVAEELKGFTFHKFALTIIKMFTGKSDYQAIQDDTKMTFIENIVNNRGKEFTGVDYDAQDFYNTDADGNPTPKILFAIEKVFDCIANKGLDINDAKTLQVIKNDLSENAHSLYTLLNDTAILEIMSEYEGYRNQYLKAGYLSFADQEPMMKEIIDEHPEILEQMGIKYVICDEYQDSSDFQIWMTKRLTQTSSFKKLVVVGHDAQGIYMFRDTRIDGFVNFPSYFDEPVKVMYLLENRRSTAAIIRLGNGIIGLNENKIDKDLIPVREEGVPVVARGFHTPEKEIEFIIDEAVKLHDEEGYAWEDIAIIASQVPGRGGLADFSAKLSERKIPWVMKNPMNLLENSRVLAAIGLCDAMYNPDVDKYYFDYLVAKYDGDLPSKDKVDEEILNLKNNFMSMEELSIPQQQAIFHNLLESINHKNDELYQQFLRLIYDQPDFSSELWYVHHVFKKYGFKMKKKLEQDYSGVVLVTAHSSKGAEWPVVFNTISGYDQSKYHFMENKYHDEIEEKRRLLFVSVTRAKDRLYVTGQYRIKSNKEDIQYNKRLIEVYNLLGLAYDPTDYEALQREAEKLEEKRKKAEERKKLKEAEKAAKAEKSREMTEEEKAEYNKLVSGSEQMNLLNFC